MTTYLLKPFEAQGLNNVIFDGPYGILRDLLKARDVDLRTYDLGDISSADKVIFFNLDKGLLKRCMDMGLGPEKLVLVLFEPEVVIPEQYDPRVWRHFGTVFTWRDDLVDGVKFIKVRYPQGQKLSSSLPTFESRKLVTMINASKYGYVAGEGYSYRRKAIRFFDSHEGFDLYGHGWNQRRRVACVSTAVSALRGGKIAWYLSDLLDSRKPLRSYRGAVTDKYETLAKYRFCLCFENQTNRPGFITEKLFDCLFCGTVPIYLGAPNIEEYVPSECYIPMNEIGDFGALQDRMESMEPEEFGVIQDAGQKFIRSDKFRPWSPEGVFGEMVERL